MAKKNSTLFSIITPVLNDKLGLIQTVESLKIQRLRDFEHIVIDGGSTDGTVEYLTKQNVKLIKSKKLGLAYQRKICLNYAKNQYIAFIDSHDLLEENCLGVLLDELKNNKWDAIQATVYARNVHTFFQKACELNDKYAFKYLGETNMVGRPCIYTKSSINFINFDPFFSFGVGNEDADVSIRYQLAGFKQGKGSGVTRREYVPFLQDWLMKWKKYGRGDVRLIIKYPSRFFYIIQHQLFNYPIKRNLGLIKAKKYKYIIFNLLAGYVRFIFCIREIILFKLRIFKNVS